MSRKLLTVILIASLALAAIISGCGQKAPQQSAKVLRVGAETTFPPFEFQDEKSKDYVGFDIDLMKAVGKQMGYEVQIASMGFDGLIPALEAGQIDAIASAMSITEDRTKKVAFSQPYYKSGLSIIVKGDNNLIKTFKDLEGKKIAVQIGTTGADEAKKIANTTVREFNSASEAYLELKAGGVDAVVNDLPVNQYYLLQSGNAKEFKMAGDVLNAEDYGIAVNKKNQDLADKINKALDELKKNGEYNKIYEKWFGKQPK